MTNSDTMFLTPYFSTEDNQFQFTREQASHFAKKVAADFNPIHDEDNKRFCVPGDLLLLKASVASWHWTLISKKTVK